MHYANGKPAREGDLVISAQANADPVKIGRVVKIITDPDCVCNGEVEGLVIQGKDGVWKRASDPRYNDLTWNMPLNELLQLVPDAMPKASEELEATAQPVGSGG